jgi:hypothetical protein
VYRSASVPRCRSSLCVYICPDSTSPRVTSTCQRQYQYVGPTGELTVTVTATLHPSRGFQCQAYSLGWEPHWQQGTPLYPLQTPSGPTLGYPTPYLRSATYQVRSRRNVSCQVRSVFRGITVALPGPSICVYWWVISPRIGKVCFCIQRPDILLPPSCF